MFRTKIGETIFNQKYRHEGCETWERLAYTLAHEVCNGLMPEDEINELAQAISNFEFIPGGRYLYYAGRALHAYNNCFGGETKLLTDRGFVRMADFAGKQVNILSPVDGQYKTVTIHNYGVQPLTKITFARVRGKQDHKFVVLATPDHRWILNNGLVTSCLAVGDVVPANQQIRFNSMGYIHGFVFGDGTKERDLIGGTIAHHVRLCGNKKNMLPSLGEYLTENGLRYSVNYPRFASGEPIVRLWCDTNLKSLPETTDQSYVAGFIRGWIDADAHKVGSKTIACVQEDAIDYFIENAPMSGIVISGKKRHQVRDTAFAKNHKIFIQNFCFAEDWDGFKVVSIEDAGICEVYCPFEPEYEQIIIDHGIHTFNCFMLRLEEDARESWADLMRNATSCLMLGGGIGVDYSVARQSGSILNRTGGIASGPISLMKMVNEAGRYIMQGGSRRSAIYASLNWKHGDVSEFLHAKDWHDMRVANAFSVNGDTYTFSHAKIDDFNHPAPLDMTNISLNYDDAWLEDKLNKTFIENCAQAMRTGEPGFSFNFGDKQKESLRNACCELTSEDDSDVCNLGSINMGSIGHIDRFIDVTYLATKFLICGTIRGNLPYQKVYDVREKNRRLGLGLMGVHEFLLKNNLRYEWNDTIQRWADAYKVVSASVAKDFSDQLGVSRPKGVRAIAPTGTISMLAGTSSGLEPIYAVAYKRRYLKNGTEWHYQYQVDGTAQAIIDRYGVKPEDIETSISLAKDYERRIKFQYEMQKYVDHAISSTINLPAWGSEYNHEGLVMDFAKCISKYALGLRGLTFYPDGSRGGQPLTPVDYNRAVSMLGKEFRENMKAIDVCTETGHGGVCGV